eukprot:4744197-Alexandrium_andersonii.AAC.1
MLRSTNRDGVLDDYFLERRSERSQWHVGGEKALAALQKKKPQTISRRPGTVLVRLGSDMHSAH